ncbi:MAG TPA: sulfatase-like hydrolase/transferase [Bacteroidia bacterium]
MRIKFLFPDRPLVSYPLLLSLLCILNSVGNKLRIAPLELGHTMTFVVVVLGFSIAANYFFRILFKEKIKAGIFTLLVLVFTFFYFDIYYSLYGVKWVHDVVYYYVAEKFHLVLVAIFGLISSSVFVFIKKSKYNFILLNRYLNLTFGLFLLFELFKISTWRESEISLQNKTDFHATAPQQEKRNVYFIVSDAYTSSASLKKYWSYDNKELIDFLRSKGFFIAENSKCNYNSTPFSIGSALNMSYFDPDNFYESGEVRPSRIADLVANSEVIRQFSAAGYASKNFSFFNFKDAPAYYADPFYSKTNLLDRTFFFLLTEKLNISHEHQQLMQIPIADLKMVADLSSAQDTSSKPFFCYAHLMMPHFPYFFNELGTEMSEDYAKNEEKKKEKYLSQLKYTNHLLIGMLEHLLSGPTKKPIIILQGDHGFRDLKGINFNERVTESETILNAYYFPDDSSKTNSLYDSVSPVNSFRIVFNKYFDAKLPLLKDRSFNTEFK